MSRYDEFLEAEIKSYEIIKEKKGGGQKKVLLAFRQDLGMVVLKSGQCSSKASLERIIREVEILRDLSSFYFPKQFDFAVCEGENAFFIVEEYIDGEVLTDVKSKYSTTEDILALVKYLLTGLGIIWQKGIVHRDLKPDNIIIRDNGKPVVIDFGIARDLSKISLTNSFAHFGPATPAYASPEQLMNQKTIIGIRTDFFLIGLLALELHLGFHPFDPKHVGIGNSHMENIINGMYVPPNSDNLIFNEFITKTVNRHPFKRFKNQEQLFDFFKI